MSNDTIDIGYESTFRDIVDKTFDNLRKTVKGFEYKDYINSFTSGFLKK